jgi:hypothetical protein
MKTVIALGLLLGVLPALAIAAIMVFALDHLGARQWPDPWAGLFFSALYLGLVGAGAYAFSRTKG